MNGLAFLVRHGSVKGALYASVLQNGPLNLFIIFSRYQFDSLDMFDRLQACGRDTISIGIIRFQDRRYAIDIVYSPPSLCGMQKPLFRDI